MCSGERERFEYDHGHSGHSFRAVLCVNYKYNIRLWRFSLLEMQRTGFLQLSLRPALSCLQLAKKEKIYRLISPQFYDKL